MTHRQTQNGVAKGDLDQRAMRQTGEKIPEPTNWRYLQRKDLGPAQLKGVVARC